MSRASGISREQRIRNTAMIALKIEEKINPLLKENTDELIKNIKDELANPSEDFVDNDYNLVGFLLIS